MTIPPDMALLAAGSYWDVRRGTINATTGVDTDNDAPIPLGWKVLTQYDESGSGTSVATGFSARVYQNIASGQIVISYAGTEFNTSSFGLAADFISGNIPLAIGKYGAQALKAADLYQRVKADVTLSDNISFTGQSLGGGLASMMAVWFDRPATVFAAAPFQRSADSSQSTIFPDWLSDLVLPRVRYLLGASIDGALSSYNPSTDFAAREANVTAYAIKGELLEANLGLFNWIEGSTNALYNSPGITLDPGNKHSIDLHVAALLVPNFETQAVNVPHALKVIMDKSLYGGDVLGSQQVIITKLIRNEAGVRDDAGTSVLLAANGMLTHFSNDLQKLGANLTGLNGAAQKALIAQGVEWYYWQTTNYAGQEFFVNGSPAGLLQYTSNQGNAGSASLGANKASTYVNAWLTPVFNAHGEFGGRNNFDQWSVATSSTGVTTTAREATKTQIYIGQGGADNFTGGNAADVILAGAGNDTLNGGAGSDLLYGGADDDTYNFNGAFGSDKILDAGGVGKLFVDGIQLTGGNQLGGTDNIWESANRLYRYTQVNGDLVISKGSGAGAGVMQGSITVQGWTAEQLGITLSGSVLAEPTRQNRTGDQRAPIKADGSYDWAATTWTSGGTLTGGVGQLDFADVIYADALPAAEMNGGALSGLGNDALSGSGGQDSIEGGMGNDLLAGGAGADRLYGGEGNDWMFGATTLTAPQRIRPQDDWQAPGVFGDGDYAIHQRARQCVNGLIIPNLGTIESKLRKFEKNDALGLVNIPYLATISIAICRNRKIHQSRDSAGSCAGGHRRSLRRRSIQKITNSGASGTFGSTLCRV